MHGWMEKSINQVLRKQLLPPTDKVQYRILTHDALFYQLTTLYWAGKAHNSKYFESLSTSHVIYCLLLTSNLFCHPIFFLLKLNFQAQLGCYPLLGYSPTLSLQLPSCFSPSLITGVCLCVHVLLSIRS